MKETMQILLEARAAGKVLRRATTEQKNKALLEMADSLERHTADILEANALDVAEWSDNLGPVMTDRLELSKERIRGMADGVRAAAALPDPVGEITEERTLSSGLVLQCVRVPLGLVAMVYESRPNVTSDAAALLLKSGNACILRSGKEARRSSEAIVRALREGLHACGLPEALVSMPDDHSREAVNVIMTARGIVDLLIPRGGAGLIRACVDHASVPVVETGTGICHVYVDEDADMEMALSVIENAKCSRTSVCNAEEVLLVHRAAAPALLPALRERLTDARATRGLTPVELRLDPAALAFIPGTPAGENDFDTEFLDYILAVRVVDSLEEAIAHIEAHSTHHSDAILTRNPAHAELFASEVDSAAVYINASTRFTDGGEFGLGCEIGISTQRLHARGPMGLKEMTTYHYVLRGSGQTR